MLLAGGQGSRLYELTEKVAKPAVSFGGKYKIIDFPLSNCVNSGIDTVGVLTQYEPGILNEYLCNGAPWDLDRKKQGLNILPPKIESTSGRGRGKRAPRKRKARARGRCARQNDRDPPIKSGFSRVLCGFRAWWNSFPWRFAFEYYTQYTIMR